jgi:diguanylate cyclase (GGDEF)-like protein/PAS domain S-box-containing protein
MKLIKSNAYKRKVRINMYTMLNGLPFDVWFKDVDGRYLYVNDSFVKYTGKPRVEILGKTDHDLYPKEEADIYEDSDQAALSGMRPGFYESEYRPGRFKEEYKSPAFQQDGNVIGTTGFSRDITDRVEISEELKRSERRFRAIFEEAPLGIGVFDSVNGNAIMVNSKFMAIVGRSLEEINRMQWTEYSHPDEIQENLDNMARLMNKEITGFCMNKRYIRSDGSIVWVNMTIAPINDRDSRFPQHLCMIQDVTEQKAKEQEILYLNYHDVLTGLKNRAFYDAEKRRLDTERQLPISIIVGDINGLKLANDMFGHGAGDRLLSEVAYILGASCRAEDIVARVGGDEFAILLPQTDHEDTQQICKRIYENCNKSALSSNEGEVLIPSISLGFATKLSMLQRLDDVEKEAEEAMYRRKLLERKSMHSSLLSSIKATMLEKNNETEAHAQRLVHLAQSMGKALKLTDEEINDLELLATLHDLGKVSIPDGILNKPGPLNDEEWLEMKRHPEIGYRIAQSTPDLQSIAEAILTHHEKWDGSGYPQGLSKEAIPLVARIIAIVDAYDAMTQDRPYRKAKSHEEALLEIHTYAGTQFDPNLAKLFIWQFPEYSTIFYPEHL